VETVLELSGTDVAFSELLATQPESLPAQAGDTAEMAPGIDFSACYARELSSLAWFVMSLGAYAHRAADVAQSAFAEAFVVWDRIQHPTATGQRRLDPVGPRARPLPPATISSPSPQCQRTGTRRRPPRCAAAPAPAPAPT
jgi:hypothetical protein